jgi:hypothetical protein
MSRFKEVRTLREAQIKFEMRGRTGVLSGLEPAELNRLYTLEPCTAAAEHPLDPEKTEVRSKLRLLDPAAAPPPMRSPLLEQFYGHELPDVRNSAISDVRELIAMNRKIRNEIRMGTELLELSVKKLVDAFPEVSRQGLSTEFRSGAAEEGKDAGSKIVRCPQKCMSSIAGVLEHTELLTMNIKKAEDENDASFH